MRWGKKFVKAGLAAFFMLAGTGAANFAFAQSADKVLDALWQCQPEFFEVLQNNKAVFGDATIDPNSSTTALPPLQVKGFSVTFFKPIQVYGLHIAGYQQDSMSVKEGSVYIWGFRVTEAPEKIAKVITSHISNAKFQQKNTNTFIWTQEEEQQLRNVFGNAKIKAPLRQLLIRPRRDGETSENTMLCVVDQNKMGMMKTLPPASVLFAKPEAQ